MSKKQKKNKRRQAKANKQEQDVNDELTDEVEKLGKAEEIDSEKRNEANFVEPSVEAKKNVELPIDQNFKCSVCQIEFKSRNKLFDHIRTENHAAPKSEGLSHNATKRNKLLAKKNKMNNF